MGSKIVVLKVPLPRNLYLYRPYAAMVPAIVATTMVIDAIVRLLMSASLTATLPIMSKYHCRVKLSHLIPNLLLLKEKRIRIMTGAHRKM